MEKDKKIPREISLSALEVEKIEVRLKSLHQDYIKSNKEFDFYTQSYISPWSLLLDLFTYFVTEYVIDGKIRFKIWNILHIKKHIFGIVKVIRFFKALYYYFYPPLGSTVNDEE